MARKAAEPKGVTCDVCHSEIAYSFSLLNDGRPGYEGGIWRLTGQCTADRERYYIKFHNKGRGFFDSDESQNDWLAHMDGKVWFHADHFLNAWARCQQQRDGQKAKPTRAVFDECLKRYVAACRARYGVGWSLGGHQRDGGGDGVIVLGEQTRGAGMNGPKIRIYQGDGRVCIETTHTDEALFLPDMAEQLEAMSLDDDASGKYDTLSMLTQIVEIACKLRGYKANVEVEQVIRAGILRPDEATQLWPLNGGVVHSDSASSAGEQ